MSSINDTTPTINQIDTNIPTTDPTATSQPQETTTNLAPLNVDPITTILPAEGEHATSPKSVSKKKSKKKSTISDAKTSRKTPKPKRGESKVRLTMEDLYLKEDPFKIKAKSNVGASSQAEENPDVEAPVNVSGTPVSPDHEKGKNVETLTADIPESGAKLGLDALSNAIDKMDIDAAGKKVVDEGGNTVHETPDIPESQKDVGPDVETSLGQQAQKVDAGAADVSENNSGFQTANDNVNVSVHSEHQSVGNKAGNVASKATVEVESLNEEASVQQEQDVVNVDDLVDEEPISKVFGISKRLRSSKGKSVSVVKETPQPKKTKMYGPPKAWSKATPKESGTKSRKRKAVSSSTSEYNVEEDVPASVEAKSVTKKSAVKKGSTSVKAVATNKISFHYPEYAHRWKYVLNRRFALERELGPDALKMTELVDLIREAGLIKTVSKLGNCYEQLVKEFLVNIPEDCDDPMSGDFQTVYVRGEKINFSPNVINNYLGIVDEECEAMNVSDDQVCKVITANQVKAWPKKGKISSGKLSVKYAVLNRVAASNWVPTTHSSDVATGLGRIIFAVGTHKKFDFGTYIFDQTIKHAKTTAVKLPTAFPTLLCDIILAQQPGIKYATDVAKKRETPLSLHYKLFGSHHVPDIAGTSGTAAATTGTMTRKDIISALKDTCSMLDERKALFEKMIAALETEDQAAECEPEEEVREAEQEAEEDAEAKTDKADEADDTEGEEDEESEDSSSED
ncbi:hypothetical protein QL285_033530 [Trifolium repens]|nr:hypothetical protein QL285_033530 [Trifolium repens]